MSEVATRQGYIQSLPKYITLCERNYLRVLKVLPPEEPGAQRTIELANAHYDIVVDGCAKYTTDITIRQTVSISDFLPEFQLSVRLYHDAKVAEVIHHDFHQRIKPSYGYPNPSMHQKDEKYQLNAFLADWLMACLESGRVPLNWDVNNGMV
ncbi:DUF1249 domain-containing protein [Pseudoalteromonas sp. MMG013]|uniref:Cytoplasmic protein n=1 Tax=Pseudoalteromonas aurantia 208 TaxID=1314867 RepID=A0ABR9E7D3_9GAMM|nr:MULTISPECIES: DUF1249 domain-containing protein [Pseudoalteromonas]MBE0366861.1 hypothetical protein [Pseudoalteromonas aurantia 208]MBQ4847025.1 DUF1249 domain-containing protein [Pseudoalteromonas sp. MMG005]MBQ4849605.1 DUF1249 domain-containing protein [Pseudoalteromonas sp. MMG012]MBQ4861469.1 DUF1249 domain-containing protein [Pseudoalteromonas sp. MMG013]